MKTILDFFANNFETCIWLAVILVALIPTLESKIAIPFAMSSLIWGANALPAWQAFLFAFIGSMLPSYFALLAGRFIRRHTTGFVSEKLKKRYSSKAMKLEKEGSTFKKYAILCSFVALPIPLTGVWTGSLIAGMSSLKKGWSMLAITIGAIISSGLITLLCTVFESSITYILLASLIIIISFLAIDFLINIIHSFRKKQNDTPKENKTKKFSIKNFKLKIKKQKDLA